MKVILNMNILVFSEAAWDDKNSFGNTVSNFLCGDVWKAEHFSNFYARKQVPDNHVKALYYNLSAVDIVKGLVKGHIEGTSFTTEEIAQKDNAITAAHTKEQKNIDKLHQNKNDFIYYGHELIWRSRIWLNRYFDAFVKKAAPDIMFAFATSPYILWPLIQYLKKNTVCKVVLLIADDVYGNYKDTAFYRRGYLKREFEKCICAADKLYGISDEMSELYTKRFGKPVTTLYKGCDLSSPPKQYLNHPIRFVYAGNLFWGRDDTLAKIAEAIERQNAKGVKATLEIYTGATVTDDMRKKLERTGTARIMGARPYEEIKRIMHEADVVLHVESFDADAKETVRYSFSTKIIDCLQSGNQVLGIGPEGIASIEYLRKTAGAVVIDRPESIETTISKLLNSNDLQENAKKTRAFALEHHEIKTVQQGLRGDFERLIS